MRRLAPALAFLAALASSAAARLDLSAASVERLDNGLTLIMLEDRTLPVVSVHAAYDTGAKDDPAGRLGLAHFFEHMAFRGSRNFPGTGLTGAIYAAGGEWHGYTWIDNTNYFSTAPKDDLPLLLSIEADRMARLELRAEDIAAEQGAVIAEMNGYANDPDSTLFDALMATHFLTHPYRNNTIGYAGDVKAITHQDVVAFYARRYAPQQAVIAIVGDVDRQAVRALARTAFGKISKPQAHRDPLTAEIARSGERRVTISLPAAEPLFKIAWPAPAARDADFPAFLVLQALVGESAGVNFNQNDWGTPVGGASLLGKVSPDLRSWIIPTAEPYAFVVSGSVGDRKNPAKTETAIQRVFDRLAKTPPHAANLDAAKEKLRAALAFDVETTEDAAHQLAYFASIGALDALLSLDAAIDKVSAGDVSAVAANYLRKDQRTIAVLEPGGAQKAPAPERPAAPAAAREGEPSSAEPVAPPQTLEQDGAPSVFLQRADLSGTIAISALVDGRYDCARCVADDLAPGRTTVRSVALAENFADAFSGMFDELALAKPANPTPDESDPLARLEDFFRLQFQATEPTGAPVIEVIAISGAIDEAATRAAAANMNAPRRTHSAAANARPPQGDIDIAIATPLAQEAVGFIAASVERLPTEIALYILSHGYSGRLGEAAISRRGLAYYIDAQFRPAREGGFVTLSAGVDPDKVDAFRALLKAEIARLQSEPPSGAEIAEAKRHLIGRKISAAQSNGEIADAMLRDYLRLGGLETAGELAARLDAISREDVLNAVNALQDGAVVTVRGKALD